jgi:hypothetical protein
MSKFHGCFARGGMWFRKADLDLGQNSSVLRPKKLFFLRITGAGAMEKKGDMVECIEMVRNCQKPCVFALEKTIPSTNHQGGRSKKRKLFTSLQFNYE